MIPAAQVQYISAISLVSPTSSRRGWLRHGNRPGDYAKAPRCGARTRAGGCCRQPAMKNGRCRMHGGLSTGPRTPEGLARSQRARWKHGFCSMEIRILRGAAAHTARDMAFLVRLARDLCRQRKQSSLGMGFIERNRRAAGSSSGGCSRTEPCPLPTLPRANARRRSVDFGDEHCDAANTGSLSSSAKRGRVGRGHGTDACNLRHHEPEDSHSTASSLGMGSIEQIAHSAGSSSGAPAGADATPSPAPALVSGSGSCAG